MTIDEAYNTCFRNPYIVPIDKHEETKSIIRDLIEEVKQYRVFGWSMERLIHRQRELCAISHK